MRYLWALILILFSALPANSDEWILPPEQGQVKKNILFLVDKSASMSPTELFQGISTMIGIMEQSVDEMNVTVMAFGTYLVKWPGPSNKSDKMPANWLELPSKDGIEEVRAWIDKVDTGSGTYMLSSLTDVSKEPVSPLTIVVITDGSYRGLVLNNANNMQELVDHLNKLNTDRKDSNLEPFTFGVILTQDTSDELRNHYKTLCEQNKFFYLQLTK